MHRRSLSAAAHLGPATASQPRGVEVMARIVTVAGTEGAMAEVTAEATAAAISEAAFWAVCSDNTSIRS